jgi:hypothetical protein
MADWHQACSRKRPLRARRALNKRPIPMAISRTRTKLAAREAAVSRNASINRWLHANERLRSVRVLMLMILCRMGLLAIFRCHAVNTCPFFESSPRLFVLLQDQPTAVSVISERSYPGPLTPLRKPPRCPVSATMTTATASIGKRYPGRASSWFCPNLL